MEGKQGSAEHPGKIILVNDGDADNDGVPDFADGFDKFDNEGSGASAAFVPLVLFIPKNRLSDKVTFTYSASDPAAIGREGDDVSGYRFTPAAGGLRIWTKDGANSRKSASVADNGDFVATGTEYNSEDLGFGGDEEKTTVTFYLEGIRPSNSLADQSISVAVGAETDIIKVVVFGSKLVRVTGSDSVVEAGGRVMFSHPSPVVSVSECALSNVRPSDDGLKLLGTLSIAGTVTSSICDLVEGSAGEITQVNVFVNGTTTADLSLSTQVTKSVSPESLLRPFPFSGSFEGTIHDLELDLGNNTITVSAADSVPKFQISGYSEHSVVVEASPPMQTVVDATVSIQLDSVVPEIPRVMSLTLNSGDETISCELIETGTGSNNYLNETEGVQVRFTTLLPSATVRWGNSLYRLDFQLTAVENSNPPTWVGTKSHIKGPLEFSDWGGWTFTTEVSSHIASSNGGSLNCYAVQLAGPKEFWPLIEKIDWAGSERRIVKGPNETFYISANGDNDRVGTFEVLPATPPQSPAPPDDDTDAWNFTKGFCRGFFDGGVDLVEGAGHLIKTLFKAGLRYNPIGIAYTTIWGDKFESEKRFVSETAGLVTALAGMLLNLQSDYANYVVSLLSGDEDSTQAVSKPYLDAFKGCAELLGAVMQAAAEKVGSADAKQIGYYTGRATFEIVTLVVATVKVAQIGKIALLDKVRPLPFFTTEIGTKAFAKIRTLIDALRFTRICFVAGTKVHTADGLKPIETIETGDLVLSRDPESRCQNLQRVSGRQVTIPASLCTIIIEDSLRRVQESIECTEQHPFFSLSRDAFVAAADLQPGDTLSTKEGGTAVIIKVSAAPNASSIRTYNLEIEQYVTYFVGACGVWVHNAAQVTCQEVHSIYRAMREAHPTENAWDVVFRMKTQLGKKSFAYKGNVWRLALEDACNDVFKKIASGELPLSAAKSYRQAKSKFQSFLSDGFSDRDRLNIHRIVESWIQGEKFGIPQAQWNDVPGFIMNGESHTGTGTPTGQKNLASKLAKAIGPMDADPANWRAITTKIREVYLNHHEQPGDEGLTLLWAVTRKWLDSKGIPTPLDPP